jgi:hypothetical protein
VRGPAARARGRGLCPVLTGFGLSALARAGVAAQRSDSDGDGLLVKDGRLCPDDVVLETNGLAQRFGCVSAEEGRVAAEDERPHRCEAFLVDRASFVPQCRRERPQRGGTRGCDARLDEVPWPPTDERTLRYGCPLERARSASTRPAKVPSLPSAPRSDSPQARMGRRFGDLRRTLQNRPCSVAIDAKKKERARLRSSSSAVGRRGGDWPRCAPSVGTK